jgi:1,2-diacylglycerol 3-alpha-glucosyltransferase
MWTNFGPYHLARLASTQELGEYRQCSVLGLELAGKEKQYPWQVENAQVNKITLRLLRNTSQILPKITS